jgi:hypothetical protein
MCVWDGMPYLSRLQVLAPIYGNNEYAANFFKKILDLRDVSCDDLLLELSSLSQATVTDQQGLLITLRRIYSKLSDMMQQNKETTKIIK